MKVIFATGSDDIDKSAANMLSNLEYETSECYFREGIDAQEGDVVVLSETLPGKIELADIVKKLRVSDVRVVLLAGNKDNFDSLSLARKMISLGAYDVIWNPLTVEKIVERIKKPAKISDIGKEINVEASEPAIEKIVPEDNIKPNRFLEGLFKRNKKKIRKAESTQIDILKKEEQQEDSYLGDTKEYVPDSSIVNEHVLEKTAVEIDEQIVEEETTSNKHENIEQKVEEALSKNTEESYDSTTEQKSNNISVLFNLSSDVVCVRQRDIPKATKYIKKNSERPMIVLDANKGLLASEFVKLNWETDWRKVENAKPEMFGNIEFYGAESDQNIPLNNNDVDTLLRFTEAALDSGRKVFISVDTEDPGSGDIYEKTSGLRLGLREGIKPIDNPVYESQEVKKGKKEKRLKKVKKEKGIHKPYETSHESHETVACQTVDEDNFKVFTKAFGIVFIVLVSLVLTGAVLYLLHIAFSMMAIKSPFLDTVSGFIRDIATSLFS